MVDIHLNWLNWFHFLILERGLLVILIDCMIFLSPLLDVTALSMNILRMGNKLPLQERFFKNSVGDLLPTLRFLGGLYNFCNFVKPS